MNNEEILEKWANKHLPNLPTPLTAEEVLNVFSDYIEPEKILYLISLAQEAQRKQIGNEIDAKLKGVSCNDCRDFLKHITFSSKSDAIREGKA